MRTGKFPHDDITELNLENAAFYIRVGAIVFEKYLEHGRGALFFSETPAISYEDDFIEDFLSYVPLNEKTVYRFPIQAIKLVAKYDPGKEIIFIVEFKDGTVSVRKWGANVLHISPLDLYRDLAADFARFMPGDVIAVKKTSGEVKKGHYVFRGFAGPYLEVIPLPEFRAGRYYRSGGEGGIIRVHSDYTELFRRTGDFIRLGCACPGAQRIEEGEMGEDDECEDEEDDEYPSTY